LLMGGGSKPLVKEMDNSLGPRDQKEVSSPTVGHGSAQCAGIVVMTLCDLSKFFIVERAKGLDGAPVTTVVPEVTGPVS
jgi:hypothetical protein